MTKVLVLAALLWPAILSASVWQRVRGEPATWPAIVQLAASRVCHQRPDRSFQTAGVHWPVCARCTGLYLSAPIGAIAAASVVRRRKPLERDRLLRVLAIAAIPTALTIALEWPRLLPVSNVVRFLAALPLGAAIAWVLVHTARER